MPIRRKSVVLFCIAAALFAAFVPAVSDFVWLDIAVRWVLLPDTSVVPIRPAVVAASEQPLPLFSLSSSRAPPLLTYS
jgi:hypothetical protein